MVPWIGGPAVRVDSRFLCGAFCRRRSIFEFGLIPAFVAGDEHHCD